MSRCSAAKLIGDAEGGGQFTLECDRGQDDHPEALHWDQALEITWAHWTAADEQECRQYDEPAPGDAAGGHGARGEPGTGPHEPTETAADRPEEG